MATVTIFDDLQAALEHADLYIFTVSPKGEFYVPWISKSNPELEKWAKKKVKQLTADNLGGTILTVSEQHRPLLLAKTVISDGITDNQLKAIFGMLEFGCRMKNFFKTPFVALFDSIFEHDFPTDYGGNIFIGCEPTEKLISRIKVILSDWGGDVQFFKQPQTSGKDEIE